MWRFGQSAEIIALRQGPQNQSIVCMYLSIYLSTHPKYYAHPWRE